MRLILLITLSMVINAFAGTNTSRRIVNLDGYWKFEIGDNLEWADPSYDDGLWEDIAVPSSWEDEGFPGYDGFAWYRTTFTINPRYEDNTLYLNLGAIDDVDEVYLNGHFIAYNGELPPNYSSFAHNLRTYTLANDFLNFSGENVLAVRVYDGGGIGGIVWGRNNITVYNEKHVPEISLSGTWKFHQGDDPEWKNQNLNDRDWENINVPAFWCSIGLKNYDGIGWYRKTFTVPAEYRNERLILLLGEIDDLDETYINGQLVGKLGQIQDDYSKTQIHHNNRWESRTYYIPSSILNLNGENTIAVRVYDGMQFGGIYDGPIGIITRDKYLKRKNRKVQKRSIFDVFFENR